MRRNAPVLLHRDAALPYGLVTVVTPDGKVTIESKGAADDAIDKLLGEIAKGVFGSSTEIAKAAKAIGATLVS